MSGTLAKIAEIEAEVTRWASVCSAPGAGHARGRSGAVPCRGGGAVRRGEAALARRGRSRCWGLGCSCRWPGHRRTRPRRTTWGCWRPAWPSCAGSSSPPREAAAAAPGKVRPEAVGGLRAASVAVGGVNRSSRLVSVASCPVQDLSAGVRGPGWGFGVNPLLKSKRKSFCVLAGVGVYLEKS